MGGSVVSGGLGYDDDDDGDGGDGGLRKRLERGLKEVRRRGCMYMGFWMYMLM